MADVFGDRVVHVDPDGHALGFLERKNLETKHMMIEEYIGNMPEGRRLICCCRIMRVLCLSRH